jgi:hypothetical protein
MHGARRQTIPLKRQLMRQPAHSEKKEGSDQRNVLVGLVRFPRSVGRTLDPLIVDLWSTLQDA